VLNCFFLTGNIYFKKFIPKGLGEGPLAQAKDWVDCWYNIKSGETKLQEKSKPSGGEWVAGRRETDTMPNWAGSCWYFMRYIDPDNDKSIGDPKLLEEWLPVDWYNGGMEHTTLHLLYSRFWHKFLFDIGVMPTSEPYAKRTSHGMVLGDGGVKMSKSVGNVINPNEIISSYGADTLRLYEMFMGPFDHESAWSTETMAGSRRYIERVWYFAQEYLESEGASNKSADSDLEAALLAAVHRTVKKITEDTGDLGFNTAVATMMELSNSFYKLREELPFTASSLWKQAIEIQIILLAPFAPHVAEEMWMALGHHLSVHVQPWPTWDEALIAQELVTIVVQINGKVRANIEMAADVSETEMVKAAKDDKKVASYLSGNLVKTVTVPGKLVNFVVG